jgi:nitrate reductase assembly molybdenum cofactor insertion protein NarJ
MNDLKHYKKLSGMFIYPAVEKPDIASKFLDMLRMEMPEKYHEMEPLVNGHQRHSLTERQEYYLKTFDVQAVCYLDIGYVLFGDDYKRAQLLVNLQEEHQKAGIDCGHELGDHLPNVLNLLAKTEDKSFAEELGYIVLIPAIRFMILKFGEVKNYYKSILEVLLDALYRDFPGEGLEDYRIPEEAFSAGNDFVINSPKSVICETMCHHPKKY